MKLNCEKLKINQNIYCQVLNQLNYKEIEYNESDIFVYFLDFDEDFNLHNLIKKDNIYYLIDKNMFLQNTNIIKNYNNIIWMNQNNLINKFTYPNNNSFIFTNIDISKMLKVEDCELSYLNTKNIINYKGNLGYWVSKGNQDKFYEYGVELKNKKLIFDYLGLK